MFTRHETLNRKQHANLRFGQGKRFGFAAKATSIPVLSAEASNIAREYVLVFDRAQPQAQALLGSQQDFNGYVTEDGQWLGRYIPAFIRAYPFRPGVLPSQQENTKDHQLVVLIDPDAPHFQDNAGTPLLDENGAPSELLNKVQGILRHLHQGIIQTAAQVNQLQRLGLLVEQRIMIKRLNIAIEGFRVINQERLKTLSGAELAELRDSGALQLIYTHLISLNNLQDSPLLRQPVAKPAVPEPAPVQDFFTDEDFNLDFSKFRSGSE